MVKLIIIDDEALARQRLEKLLSSRDDVKIVHTCSNGRSAIEAINQYRPDLIFLDIHLKGMTGFDVLRAIPQAHWPITIFATAHDEYAIQAFEVFAFDYLLKPFKEERFYASLDKAVAAVEQKKQQEHIDQLKSLVDYLQQEQQKQKPSPLTLKHGSKISLVQPHDIRYVAASGYYIEVYIADNKKILLRESMTNMLELLSAPQFFRVHRSTIINMDFLAEVQYTGSGDVVVKMKDARTFRVSKSYKDDLFKRL